MHADALSRSILRSWPKSDAGISDQFFAITSKAYGSWFAKSEWVRTQDNNGSPEFAFGFEGNLNVRLYREQVAFNQTYDILGCIARTEDRLQCWRKPSTRRNAALNVWIDDAYHNRTRELRVVPRRRLALGDVEPGVRGQSAPRRARGLGSR